MRLRDLTETEWRRPRKLPSRLYHGTSVWGAASILISDTLQGMHDDEEKHMGVSLSHSFSIAYGYSMEAGQQKLYDLMWARDESPWRDEYPAGAPQKGVVLVMDGPTIASHHDHVALRWQGTGRPEVRVLGDLTPVSGALVEVRFDDADVRWWIEQYGALTKLPPARNPANQSLRDGLIEGIPLLETLIRHPLRNHMGPNPHQDR